MGDSTHNTQCYYPINDVSEVAEEKGQGPCSVVKVGLQGHAKLDINPDLVI